MTESPTLLHALYAARRDDRGITLLPERRDGPTLFRSWPQIARGAWGRAAKLREAGVSPGDRVVLALPTGLAFVETFLGLQAIGAVPVPAYPPAALDRASLALERISHVARDAGATLCLTDRQLLPLLGGLAVGGSNIRRVHDVDVFAGEADPRAPIAAPGDLAFVQYTSGSTDDPKGVRVSHGGVVANCRAMALAVGARDDDVVVSWLPLYHDLGLVCSLMASVWADLPLVLMPPQAFLLEPRRWLQAMSDHRGTLCQAPTFAYARATKRVRDLSGLDLSRWRVALVTAEPVHHDVVEAFADRFMSVGFRRDALRPAYGLAECTAGVTFPTEGARFDHVDAERLTEGRAVPSEEGVVVADLGPPLPGHAVRVVRGDGALCEEREVGLVEVVGPSLMQGYYGRPREVVFTEDGWLRTFDLGYLVEGRLHLCGREKEIVVVRGRKFHPDDIERAACTVSGVSAGGIVAFGVYDDARGEDDVVVLCEVGERGPAERAALIEAVIGAIADRCGLTCREVALVAPGALPKTSSGKRQRRKARELWATGALSAPSTGKRALAAMVARSGFGLVASRIRRRIE